MAQFRSAVVTSVGKALVLQSMQDKSAVSFTTLKVGSGTYSGSENLETATSLKQMKNSFTLTSVQRIDNNTLKIAAAVDNKDITVGYNMTEYGVFAKVGTGSEVLIAIATAINADYIPDFTTSPVSILVEMYIKLTNSSNVSFEFTTPSGIYATIAELELKADKSLVDMILDTKNVLLPLSNWIQDGEFWEQEVSVPGIIAANKPILVKNAPYNISEQALKAYNKNFGYISSGVAECRAGKVAFKVLKKPTTDIIIGLKGV